MNLSIWHHSKICGDGIPDSDFALRVFTGQIDALQRSGLFDAAQDIHFGINGGDSTALLIAEMVPNKSQLHVHGVSAKTEIPTMNLIREWLPGHEDWFVLYHHTKGVTHPTESLYDRWRERMENACIWNWQQCIKDLESGYEAVGCHWLTPERYRASVTSPFFGGTFWWARARYLSQLPKLPEATWANRFEAESWIGRRRPYPIVRDYYPGWP